MSIFFIYKHVIDFNFLEADPSLETFSLWGKGREESIFTIYIEYRIKVNFFTGMSKNKQMGLRE